MNLEQSLIWFRKHIDELKAQGRANGEIETAVKFDKWLRELCRYRLFMSEFRREIELTPQKSKEELLAFIDEEVEDWRLGKKDIIE